MCAILCKFLEFICVTQVSVQQSLQESLEAILDLIIGLCSSSDHIFCWNAMLPYYFCCFFWRLTEKFRNALNAHFFRRRFGKKKYQAMSLRPWLSLIGMIDCSLSKTIKLFSLLVQGPLRVSSKADFHFTPFFCRDFLALKVYVALCYYKLDYYDVSQEVLAVYLQSIPDSTIALNLKACNHFRLYNGKAAEVLTDRSLPILVNAVVGFHIDVVLLRYLTHTFFYIFCEASWYSICVTIDCQKAVSLFHICACVWWLFKMP